MIYGSPWHLSGVPWNGPESDCYLGMYHDTQFALSFGAICANDYDSHLCFWPSTLDTMVILLDRMLLNLKCVDNLTFPFILSKISENFLHVKTSTGRLDDISLHSRSQFHPHTQTPPAPNTYIWTQRDTNTHSHRYRHTHSLPHPKPALDPQSSPRVKSLLRSHSRRNLRLAPYLSHHQIRIRLQPHGPLQLKSLYLELEHRTEYRIHNLSQNPAELHSAPCIASFVLLNPPYPPVNDLIML